MRDSTDNAELMLESYFAGYAGLSQSGFSPVGFFDVLGRRRDPGEGWDDSVHDFREVGMHAFQKWRLGEPLPEWCQQRLRECGDHASVSELMHQLGYGADDVHDPDIDTGKAFLFRPRLDCD